MSERQLRPGRRTGPGLRLGSARQTGRMVSTLPALILSAAAVVMIVVGLLPRGADAAPNPMRSKKATHTVSIAADGSYTVRMDTQFDLALPTSWTFGGEIYDGFRLPDTESPLPPHLRAEYSQPQGSIDSAPGEAGVDKHLHSVDIGFSTGELDPGLHRGVLDYAVSGAAVPAQTGREENGPEAEDEGGESGVVVYFRPLDRGEVIIESEAPITGVDCEELAPHGQPCGERAGERWTVDGEDLLRDGQSIDAVRITLDADPEELADPVIDS
jgi:hypothetical protein